MGSFKYLPLFAVLAGTLALPLAAQADGITSTGTSLPVGTVDGTVLVITGGGTTGDANFSGTLEAGGNGSFGGTLKSTGIFSAPAGINVNNNGVIYPTGNALFLGDVTIGSVGSTGWGTSSSVINGDIAVQSWDAHYDSLDSETGKTYELIGTYHGWDPNSVYIAGYNAGNSLNGFANAQSISFGGYDSGNAGWPTGNTPAMFVDLIGHNVGIGTTAPQGTLDVKNSTNTATICLNGHCTSNISPQGCHVVTAKGAGATEVADARCASNEYVISGGGMANQWTGSASLCPGDPYGNQDNRGFLHTNVPDTDLQGWSIDAYSTTENTEACTVAFAICCPR